MGNINAIIIEESLTTAQRIKALIEKQCPYITISDMSVNPDQTEKIVRHSLFDIVILSFKSGLDYAFELLQKVPNTMEDKELILIATERERILQKITKTAINFITLPLAPNSISGALEKAKSQILGRQDAKQVPVITPIKSVAPLRLLAIPSLDAVNILKIDEILYLKSDGKYTSFHTTANKTIVSSTNLGTYEKKLIHNNFFRIHNSFLVNMDHCINVHKKDGVYIEMSNRAMIPVAKRKKELLFQFLGIK